MGIVEEVSYTQRQGSRRKAKAFGKHVPRLLPV
jgi:hypothetical protein